MSSSGGGARILCLDEGGVRCYSSIIILGKLLENVQRRKQLRVRPEPWECFDLICGSGFGGVIALLLGRLRMVRGFYYQCLPKSCSIKRPNIRGLSRPSNNALNGCNRPLSSNLKSHGSKFPHRNPALKTSKIALNKPWPCAGWMLSRP